MGLIKNLVRAAARRIVAKEAEAEQDASQRQSFIGDVNERPIEYGFAFRQLGSIECKDVLDVGTGRSSFPQLLAICGLRVTAIDNVRDYWTDGLWNRHWPVVHCDIKKPRLFQQFDAITCISVLEHIKEHDAAMKGIFSLLREGGHLVLTVPFNCDEYHPDVYSDERGNFKQDSAFIGQSFSDAELNNWLKDNNASLEAEELYEAFTGKLWRFGERIMPLKLSDRSKPHQLGCFLLKKN